MKQEKILREYLKAQFSGPYRTLWYEDKQMLNQGKLLEFARQQRQKARNVFRLLLPLILINSWYVVTSLIEYGATAELFDLVFGLSTLAVLLVMLGMGAREYYSIKGTMDLLITIFEEDSSQDVPVEKQPDER